MAGSGQAAARLGVALAAWATACSPAMSWTRPGHMVTAAIAFEELESTDPAIIDRLAAVLDSHPDRGSFEVAEDRSEGRERALRLMMECARWPDDARLTVHDQPSWHVQLRPVVRAEDPPPTMPEDDIIMDGREAFALNARVMANPEATAAQRAVALCWVMHLAGDVHQPLHAAQLFSSAYPNGDRAGGLQFVIDPLSNRPETLHWFWDDSVHRSGDITSVRARATSLQDRFPRASLREAAAPAVAGDYPAWAAESYDIAVSLAYAYGVVGGPSLADARALPDAYVRETVSVAERRVTLAGYRMADILRESFADTMASGGV